jgi:hypothetical protein
MEAFVAILTNFQQMCAFGGNHRNPDLGVFQQNTPRAVFQSKNSLDVDLCTADIVCISIQLG